MATNPAVAAFLKNHSRRYLEMALNPEKRRRLDHPDGYGEKRGDCGDTVGFFLRTAGETIQTVCFDIHGCIHTMACANAVAHLAEGKAVEEAWEITPDEVAGYLETLPGPHFHCAELAVGAFYLALRDLRDTRNHPWKTSYRTLPK